MLRYVSSSDYDDSSDYSDYDGDEWTTNSSSDDRRSPIACKKPREEFDIWGRYVHGRDLLDSFGFATSSSDLPALFENICTYLRHERKGLEMKSWVPTRFPEPLLRYVNANFPDSMIAGLIRYFDTTFTSFEGTRSEWTIFKKKLAAVGQVAGGSNQQASPLRHQLKLIGLKLSSDLKCTFALFHIFKSGLMIVQDEFNNGPLSLRDTKADVRSVMKRLLKNGVPHEKDRVTSYSEWFWALTQLRTKSKTRVGSNSFYLLDAAFGFQNQDLGETLCAYYHTCCKMRIAEELATIGFDQTGIPAGKSKSRLFLFGNVAHVQDYLENGNSESHILKWTNFLSGKKSPAPKPASTAAPPPSAVVVPKPTPSQPTKQLHTSADVKGGGDGRKTGVVVPTKPSAPPPTSSKTAKKKAKKNKAAVVPKAFQSHVTEFSQRLVMLADSLAHPKYDGTKEDGLYVLLLEIIANLPTFITFVATNLLPLLHTEFLQEWRKREELVIAAIHGVLEKNLTSGNNGGPTPLNAWDILKSDDVLLVFAFVMAGKMRNTPSHRCVEAAERFLSQQTAVVRCRFDDANFDPDAPTAPALAKKFVTEVDLALCRGLQPLTSG